ncbi:MAG: hypothetical protein HON90_15785, partial [Halobacteriovoraceae bacterium]|nr:hypothetical protein [Halobacteriovoraceae bacterium]
LDATSTTTAIRSGMSSAGCPGEAAAVSSAAGATDTWYPAGKGNGAVVADAVTYIVDASMGNQSSLATQTFTISAAGVIMAGFTNTTGATGSSVITLTDKKIFSNVRQGY